MNKLLVGGAAAALVVAFAPTTAQPAPPPPPGVAPGVAPPAPIAPLPPERRQVHVMMMSDHDMTRAEVAEHVSKLFAKLDSNKDGYITKDEVEAFHSKMMGTMEMGGDIQKRLGEHGVLMGDRSAMFDRLDTNHDGSISRQEFMAAQPQVRTERVMIMRGPDGGPPPPGPAGEPNMMKMRMHGMSMHEGMGGFGGHLFEMADANHDGRVSLAEAQAGALAHFDKADLNHDGKITPDERQQMHKVRIERHTS